MTDPRLDHIRSLIRDVPDFPKPGILFKDITPLLGNGDGFAACIEMLAEQARALSPDVIAGPEARGFIFGAPLARELGIGFAPVRKTGKLPWKTTEETYDLEYGQDTIAMHEDALQSGQRVLLVDDLLATGGTMAACRRLAERSGAEVVACHFVIELEFLSGRAKLDGLTIESLLSY